MRRKIRNDKVLRAISIGLAAMIAVTATPVSVLAEENNQEEQQTTPTPESASADATEKADEAKEYTGTLEDGDKDATGTIGTKAQEALDDVAKAEAAVKAGNNLAGTASQVTSAMNALLADGKPGGDGYAQVKNSEDTERDAETAFGVKLNDNGTVNNQAGLNNKVSDANTAIKNAEDAKTAAGSALKGVDGAITTANGLISTASGKQSTADESTKTANTAIETKAGIDSKTQEKLNGIKSTLEAAVVETDINKAVGDAAQASLDALGVVGDQLQIAEQALQQAVGAADDAEKHSASYNRQQMIALANAAQNAADNANNAVKEADKAVTTAKQKEKEAAKAVSDAQTALTNAQNDAAAALKEYKKKIDEINVSIKTANSDRAEAKSAMEEANKAIDNALKLMEDTTDPSVEGAKKKVEAMNSAITAANKAIEKVTGLSTKAASDRLKWTNQRLQTQIDNLTGAKKTYDEAIAKTGEAAANKEAAENLLTELDGLINGLNNVYAGRIKEVDVDINDLKALLSGYNGSYKQLADTAEGAQGEVNSQAGILVSIVNEKNLFGDSEENKNLTADQIVAKYNTAVSDNETLDTTISTLAGQISEKENTIKYCNENEGSFKTAYDNSNGEVAKDEAALNKKYVYSYNAETKQYEFETDKDGNPVYCKEYNDLVELSRKKEADREEYMCGSEILGKDVMPTYSEGDSRYIKVGDGTVTSTGKPESLNLNDKDVSISGYGSVFEVVGDKLIETIPYSYDVYRNTGKKIEGYEGNSYICPNSQGEPSEDAARKEILRMLLNGNNLLNASLKPSDLSIGRDGKTVTVSISKDDRIEDYTFGFSITDIQIHEKLDYYSATYNATIKEKQLNAYGSYNVVKEYDFKEYKLTTIEGDYTTEAKQAQETLRTIDNEADTAKKSINDHKKTRDEKLKAWDDLKTMRSDAADALYGYYSDGTKDKPADGSLLVQKSKAEETYQNNDTIISALGSTVSQYNTALNYKGVADENLKKANEFDPEKATGLTEDQKTWYQNALNAKQTILDEKEKAKGYKDQVSRALTNLETSLKNSKDGAGEYNTADGLIKDAQDRLGVVSTKITALNKLKETAIGSLTGKGEKVNDATGDTKINTLFESIQSKLSGLAKFNSDDYDPLDYVAANGYKTEDYLKLGETSELSLDSVNKDLAAAINTAAGILETAKNSLKEAIGLRQNAEMVLYGGCTVLDDEGKERFVEVSDYKEKNIKYYADLAQEAADRAAKALADWRAPRDDDDDDDDDDDSSSSSSTGVYTYTGTSTGIPVYDLTGMTSGDTGRGVAGARTGRTVARGGAADTSGVLGVKSEKVETPAKEDTKTEKSGENTKQSTGDQNLTKVENNLVPLADTPFEEGMNMNYLWLLAAAAAAGAGAYGYDKHRKKVAANDETKKYKK